jgi:hypothetical protein
MSGEAEREAVWTGDRPVRRVLLEPAIPVIVLATIVHVIRRDLVDIALFSGTAILIVADRLRTTDPPGRSGGPPGRVPVRRAAVVGGCVGYAVLVGPMSRTGWPLRVALIVPGLVAVVSVLRRGTTPREQRVPGPPRGWWVWPALFVVGCLWELAAFVQQPDAQTGSYEHPTLSTFGEPLLAMPLPRAIVAALWLAAGWWLVRRIVVGRERP